ncbi:MAG: hypothetical protein E7202_00760 [Selenomonas ruminantium]|nr:hypothetical protein [Selenomonas ruminantium]
MHDKIAYLIKHYLWIQKTYRFIFNSLLWLIGLFVKIDDRLVLLSSYGGKNCGDSPKVLYEAMKADERFADYKYIWTTENVKSEGTVCVDTISYFFTALRAKIWITNVNIERGLSFKKKETIYLNTWHGTGPKKGGNAVPGRNDYDFSDVNILCVDGKYMHDVMLNYFGAEEENLLYSGRPREDELFSFTSEDSRGIKEKLGIPVEKKIILYMPTWREYQPKDIDYKLWKNMLGEEYVVLIRAHHFACDIKQFEQNENYFIDVTAYNNVNELYFVADILISDYSSAFFDYGLLKKPMFCYAYDYDRYVKEYGLFMDLEAEFPRGIKRNEVDLLEAINSMDYEQYAKECSDYCHSYVAHDGQATQACLKRLKELLDGDGFI